MCTGTFHGAVVVDESESKGMQRRTKIGTDIGIVRVDSFDEVVGGI